MPSWEATLETTRETVTSILWLEVDSLCADVALGLPMPNDEDSPPCLDVLTVARAVLC